MSRILAPRAHIKTLKRSLTAGMAVLLGSSSVMAIVPATAAHAADLPATATISKVAGTNIANTELLTGTASDPDGVTAVNVQFVGAKGSSVPVSAVVNGDVWSLQLSKGLLAIQPDITNPAISLNVTVTDSLSNQSNFTFGPFNYVIPGAETFQSIVAAIAGLDPAQCAVTQALQVNGAVTVFGPNNEALAAIPAAELQALVANPDELCAVLATHILAGRVASTDITAPVTVESENPNNLPLTVEPKDGTVVVNDQSAVVNADNNINGYSILHVVNALINPRSSVVDIDDIYTNVTSPELRGNVEGDLKVAVRINGVQYEATNNGDGTWKIPAGVVVLDPTKPGTLFSVIARQQVTPSVSNPSGLVLMGISLRSDVLHYVQPGMGSGSGTTSNSVVSNVVATLATAVEQVADSTSSQSTATSTNTPKTEAPSAPSENSTPSDKTAETPKAKSNQWYWWLIGIATLGALYYILGGNGTPTTTKKK